MTANVAQAIVDPQTWRRTLRGAYEALRPGGHLVFETRDPARRAWEEWNRETSYRVTDVSGVGAVEYWVQLTEVHGPLVSFRQTYIFIADTRVLTSDSTLRFCEHREIETELTAQGYTVEAVRDAPDRPGRELVFVARRTDLSGRSCSEPDGEGCGGGGAWVDVAALVVARGHRSVLFEPVDGALKEQAAMPT